jgi:hypothetical protein
LVGSDSNYNSRAATSRTWAHGLGSVLQHGVDRKASGGRQPADSGVGVTWRPGRVPSYGT